HTSLFRELLTYMMEDPRSIGFCAHLLFCAKNLERIGDHAPSIAETTHCMITGDMLATERPKADESSGVDPSWEPRKSEKRITKDRCGHTFWKAVLCGDEGHQPVMGEWQTRIMGLVSEYGP